MDNTTDTSQPQTLYIRTVIFLITGLCAGLPALVWAARTLHQLQSSGVRVSVFIITLLFTDAWEHLITPFLLNYIPFTTYHHWDASVMTMRMCGVYLHQLVALERTLSLRYPLCSSRLSSPLISIPLSLTMILCALYLNIRSPYFSETFLVINIILFVFTCIVAVTTCIITCKTYSYTSRKPGLDVLFVAIFSLILVALPFFLLILFTKYTHMFYPITSLRLIADPLQCVLVCRETSRRQPLHSGKNLI